MNKIRKRYKLGKCKPKTDADVLIPEKYRI
jgi:hypothetical protein